MDVLFDTGDGRFFKEEIWFFSPVHEIKQKLHKQYGFPISCQTFFFNGKIMEDERDIEYYNSLQGSRILLRLAPLPQSPNKGSGRRVKVTLVVPRETLGMRRVVVEVNLVDNVSELRKELLRMREKIYGFCFRIEGFFFIFKQNVMEEDRTFRWHGVKSDCRVQKFLISPIERKLEI